MTRHLGDGMLITVPSAAPALRAAFALVNALPRHNSGRPDAAALRVRVGLHVDDVVVDQLDIFGAGVNLTARVASLANPDDIVCTDELRDQSAPGVDADFEDLGLCYLKHVSRPVRAYRARVPRAARSSGRAEAPRTGSSNTDLRPTVAVLPFAVRSDSHDAACAGDLLADTLIARISRGAPIRMISRLSTAPFRNREWSLADVGDRLGATFVLSGHLQVSGSQVSAFAELAELGEGEVVWADTVSGSIGDLVSPDEELAARMATEVCRALMRHELTRARRNTMPTLASYSLLLAGTTLMHRFRREDFDRAQLCLSALSERLPRHAEPYAWLARWHALRVAQGWSDNVEDERARANDMCRRALDLDPESPLALTMAGSVKVGMHKDLDGAQLLYREALRIDPNEPLAQLLLGTTHAFKGEGEEAVLHTERAIRLTPLDPLRFFYDGHAAGAALTAGHFERAIELAKRSLAENSLHHSTLRILAIAQSLAGQEDDARLSVQRLRAVEPELTVTRFVQRSPGGSSDHGRRFAEALRAAGLPD